MEAITLIVVEILGFCFAVWALKKNGYEIRFSIEKEVPENFWDDDDDGGIDIEIPIMPIPDYHEPEWDDSRWNPVNRIMNDINLN